MVFLGGAVLANIVSAPDVSQHWSYSTLLTIAQMAERDNMWISKQEWQEQGSRALEKLGARS